MGLVDSLRILDSFCTIWFICQHFSGYYHHTIVRFRTFDATDLLATLAEISVGSLYGVYGTWFNRMVCNSAWRRLALFSMN